jgi:hypothetical protein
MASFRKLAQQHHPAFQSGNEESLASFRRQHIVLIKFLNHPIA